MVLLLIFDVFFVVNEMSLQTQNLSESMFFLTRFLLLLQVVYIRSEQNHRLLGYMSIRITMSSKQKRRKMQNAKVRKTRFLKQ